MACPPARRHRIPERLSRSVTRVLQAASTTREPLEIVVDTPGVGDRPGPDRRRGAVGSRDRGDGGGSSPAHRPGVRGGVDRANLRRRRAEPAPDRGTRERAREGDREALAHDSGEDRG